MARKRAKMWIAGAHLHKGALHRALGIPEGTPLSTGLLRSLAKGGSKLAKQARLALTLRRFGTRKRK